MEETKISVTTRSAVRQKDMDPSTGTVNVILYTYSQDCDIYAWQCILLRYFCAFLWIEKMTRCSGSWLVVASDEWIVKSYR